MRRLSATFGLAALIGLLASLPAAGQTEKDPIRLTNGEWQPYLSQDLPNGGIASHIITEAFALVGVSVEYGFFPWSRAMKLAKEGTWDGSAVWGDSGERRADFFFSEPVIATSWVFFYLKDRPFDWNGYEDLSDLKVGGTIEYYYGDEFETAEAAGVFQTIRGRSDEVGLTNLLKGRIDVFPGELLVTYAQIHDTFPPEDEERFTNHPRRIEDRPLYVLFSRKAAGSEGMRDRFDEGLALLKQSGRYDQIFVDAMKGK